jgi:hypothetical protein
MSAPAFRDEVARQLLLGWPGLCFEKPDDHRLNVGRKAEDCAEMELSTANTYRNYENDPEHGPEHLANLVSMALEGLATLEHGASIPLEENLVVALRPRAFTSFLGQPGEEKSGVWQIFMGDLVAILAEQDRGRLRFILTSDLKGMRLNEEDAWRIARANLSRKIGVVNRTEAEGAVEFSAASGLATSYLLLPDTCRAGGASFDVHVGARDGFLYVDRRNAKASDMLAGYVAHLVQTGEAYSENLISCENGSWYALAFDGVNAWRPDPAPN